MSFLQPCILSHANDSLLSKRLFVSVSLYLTELSCFALWTADSPASNTNNTQFCATAHKLFRAKKKKTWLKEKPGEAPNLLAKKPNCKTDWMPIERTEGLFSCI